MVAKDYFDAEGVLIKHQGGKTIQETTMLKYWFAGDIKKRKSPRYMQYKDKINGQLVIDSNNQHSAFLIYVEHDDYDIRFKISYELMTLILEVRNSMYDLQPIKNPFYSVGRSEINFNRLSFTPKLIEALTTKRKPLTDAKRKQILLTNSKEILALKDKHAINVLEFLKDEEARSQLENEK